MVEIGGIKIDVPLALAPMAGVTDLAFRTICRSHTVFRHEHSPGLE